MTFFCAARGLEWVALPPRRGPAEHTVSGRTNRTRAANPSGVRAPLHRATCGNGCWENGPRGDRSCLWAGRSPPSVPSIPSAFRILPSPFPVRWLVGGSWAARTSAICHLPSAIRWPALGFGVACRWLVGRMKVACGCLPLGLQLACSWLASGSGWLFQGLSRAPYRVSALRL